MTRTSAVDGANTLSSRISAVKPTTGCDDDHHRVGVPRQPLELEEDQPDEERVDSEQECFHQPAPLRMRRGGLVRGAARGRACISTRVSSGGSVPALLEMIELRRAGARAHRAIELAARGELALFDVVVVVLLGAVGELVPDRTRVGPQPGDRPEQSAEHEREQAQDVDRILVADGGALRRSSRAARARSRTAR